MAKNPSEPDETEPEGGRAAERLRQQMLGRFEEGTPAESGDEEEDSDAAKEETPPAPGPESTEK
jgi:hypothetical protein